MSDRADAGSALGDATDAAPAEPDGLPVPRRYFSILAIWLAIGMSVLDGAIANVALPTIGRDLGVDAAASIWIVNAYQLAIVAFLLPFASLGDKLGYRRVYVAGLTVFTVGSLACALSQDLAQLTLARVLQGIGAAAVMAINAALVRFTYPSRLLGRGIGLNAVVISMAAAAGPTIASAVLAAASWPWLFAINVPVGLLAIALAAFALPRTEGTRAPLDFVSAALTAVSFVGIIFGIEGLARDGVGWGAGALPVGLLAAVVLIRRERSRESPMIPLDLLRVPLLRLSILASVITFGAQMLAFVALPFFFQDQLGRSAVETGLLMTPWPLAVAVSAPVAGRLADRFSAGVLGAIGLLVFGAGLAALALLPQDASTGDVIWRMALCGLGFGFFQAPNNRAIVTSAPRRRSGAAGGLLSSARLLGQTAGALAVATLFHAGLPGPTVVALACAAAVAVLAAGVSLLRVRA